jgi:hypothetical protein
MARALYPCQHSASAPANTLEDEDDDEDSLPDEACGLQAANFYGQRSRENEAPCKLRCQRNTIRSTMLFVYALDTTVYRNVSPDVTGELTKSTNSISPGR